MYPVASLIVHWSSVSKKLKQRCLPASVKQSNSCDWENTEQFPCWCCALSQLFFSWVTVLWPVMKHLFFKQFLYLFPLLVSFSLSFLSVKTQLWQRLWKASQLFFLFWSKVTPPAHKGTHLAFVYDTAIVWACKTPCFSKFAQPAAVVLFYLSLCNFGFG